MKIGILSRNETLYSTKRLVEAIEEKEHEAVVIDHLKCDIVIEQDKPTIFYKGQNLSDFDAIIPRIGASVTFYGTAVVRQFEMMNVFTAVESQALVRSRDKLRSLQILASAGVGLPKTVFTNYSKEVDKIIESVGEAPLIVKLLEGTQGYGVVLVPTKKAAQSIIEAFHSMKARVIVQEFVQESKGADIRAFVVNGRVVGAMKRQGKEGEFRSNLHQGGSGSLIKLTKKEREVALTAAKAMGLPIAGVDLLQSDRGPLILEVNSSPGLEGIEKATNKDIAGAIIEYVTSVVQERQSKPKKDVKLKAMPEFISINKQKIGLGEEKVVNFYIASLPTRTHIELPVHIFRSKIDGPVLLLTGGLHGDEINGVEIIRRMITEKSIYPEKGSVIAIPIVNIYGFIQNSRGLPDGKDINRSFPGTKSGGSLASMLAYTLMKHIIPRIDFGIDYHTGGACRSNFPQLRVDFRNSDALELAKLFNPPVIINSKTIAKSFRKAAQSMNKSILVYETGESLRFDEKGIQEGIDGTLRLMHAKGMITKSPKPLESMNFHKSTWVRAKFAGLFSPEIGLGQAVKKRQLLGYINGAYGELNSKILAPKDGFIIGINNCPVVNKGDALIHYSYN